MGIDPEEGGTSEVILTTTTGEIDAGISVTLASPSTGSAGERRSVETLTSAGAEVMLFPLPGGGLFRRWAISPSLLVWMGRNVRRFDVAHVHGAWGLVPVGALCLLRISGVASVLTVHEALTDYDLRQTARRHLVPLKRIGRRLILSLADDVVVASDLERRHSAPSRARVAVIPHPVASRAATTSAEFRRTSAVVGFIGRFHEKKNLPLLLDALSRLPGVELLVAGHGEQPAVHRMRILADRLGVADRVTWLGWIGPDERAAFYQQIDVLAMPSMYECYGMVAAEAMSNGKPVVVTETTGAAELARRSRGGLVTGQDPAQIAEALRRLLSDPELKRSAGMLAAAFAAARLTPREYGHTILDVYRSARSRKVRGRSRRAGGRSHRDRLHRIRLPSK